MSPIIPGHSTHALITEYETALRAYLSGDGERMLERAYEVGRASIEGDVSLLDVIELHQHIVNRILSQSPPEEIPRRMADAMAFLEESLSPYEITHRGYWNAMSLVRRITWFTSIASHELKSPLTSILSSAGMLRDLLRAGTDSPENRLLENVLNSAAILKSRMDDMTDIAGLYSGSLSIKPRRVQIAGFLRQVCGRLETEVRSRGMILVVDADDAAVDAEIDPVRIEQVITNLVQNATKYATDGGRIDLSASGEAGGLRIEVRDYGRRGSRSAHIKHILTDETLTRDTHAQGTGLGLILCRQLIAAHHGRINVLVDPGRGSAIRVWLPLRQEHTHMEGNGEGAHR